MNEIVLDIETTGLAATDELVSYTLGKNQGIRSDDKSESELLSELTLRMANHQQDLLLTFNGHPKYGTMKGYDIPFLRTRYIKNDKAEIYPFTELQHLDVSELAKKTLMTAMYTPSKVDDLSADQVVQLMHSMDLVPTKTKKGNVAILNRRTEGPALNANQNIQETIDQFLYMNLEAKVIDHNSLDSICENIFNNWNEEMPDEISGKDVPKIWNQYLAGKNPDCLMKILNHNLTDARKTIKLYRSLEQLTSYRPISTL